MLNDGPYRVTANTPQGESVTEEQGTLVGAYRLTAHWEGRGYLDVEIVFPEVR